MELTYIVIAIVLGLVSGYGFYLFQKNRLKEEKEKILEDAEKILEDAKREAETIKKEAQLSAKEVVYQLKSEAEKEIKEKTKEINYQEKRLRQKEELLDRKIEQVEKREIELNKREREIVSKEKILQEKENNYNKLIAEQQHLLEKIAGMKEEEAKQELFKKIEQESRFEAAKLIKKIEEEAKQEADKKAKEILSLAVQRYASDYVVDATVTAVSLPNDEMKGRIIGREGRNIRAFESLTGVDLVVDDTPELVILSSFDPIKREVARIALERLIVDGRIHPARIEEVIEKARRDVDTAIRDEGEKAVFELGLSGVHPEIIKLIGRLKYRTSYGQNVLQHSKEVAWLSGLLAGELDVNIKLAKRAGLLHDIGKAVDHEMEGSHQEIGAMLARKYGESEEVINAILSHHEDVEFSCVESALVAAADALSAARPGVRRETIENYIKRLTKLEELAMSFHGVQNCYAIQAGREVRLIVEPEIVSDEECAFIARELSKRIEKELSYPGQIKVTVIRESRFIEYAK
ncbi:ribonuclease Y [Thermodesulfovibrio thiophilus]|uniref:ribonuclease Y n=1 Tax=Thermodesulfovibrio thiophilus TaxID=340095 RepID=UPI00040A122D|nr:ribonuclease Y [Thermodesulfovibrio thiophilus]